MKVAFLDRDGVINKDSGYLYKVEDFEFLAGCVEALQLLQQKGYHIIIVTNQSGIGRGYYTEGDYQQLTRWYLNELLAQGVAITDVFHCPHTPEDACDCRKPQAGLFLQAANKYSIDYTSAIMVGDKLSDIEAAKAAGISQCFLLASVYQSAAITDYPVYSSLLECVKKL